MVTRVEDGKTPRFQSGGILNDTVTLDVVSTNATSNTYDAYVELIADSGSDPIYLGNLTIQGVASASVVFEIALGAGGSEVPLTVVATNLISANELNKDINLNNVRVPPNSRIAIRVKREGAGIQDFGVNINFNK